MDRFNKLLRDGWGHSGRLSGRVIESRIPIHSEVTALLGATIDLFRSVDAVMVVTSVACSNGTIAPLISGDNCTKYCKYSKAPTSGYNPETDHWVLLANRKISKNLAAAIIVDNIVLLYANVNHVGPMYSVMKT